MLLAQGPVSNPKANKQMRRLGGSRQRGSAADHYNLFHSALIHGDYSYLVYLPPDYETSPQRHYPSIYFLHGGGGAQRGGVGFVKRLDAAIRNGSAPAAIVFLLNGLGESCWADSKDGKLPVESIIVKEMVPGFDRTYRTIPRREARAIEGMSMGGYGALRLGFVHNDVFGVVTGLAPGLISEKDEPAKIPPAAFEKVMGSDPAYFHDHTAWTAAEQNAAKIRSTPTSESWWATPTRGSTHAARCIAICSTS